MTKITITDKLSGVAPGLTLSCIESHVGYQLFNPDLWKEVEEKVAELSIRLSIDLISKINTIDSSRRVYRACGKDPARYRLSAEALLRRVVNRKEIYQVNNIVDLLNLVSVSTGFSIGGYDSDKIVGEIAFGIGQKGEPYEGIGRGTLNIDEMPVFRDEIGAFGTSTSDSLRTSVTENTKRFLMVIVDYEESNQLEKATHMAVSLFEKYAKASEIQIQTIKSC